MSKPNMQFFSKININMHLHAQKTNSYRRKSMHRNLSQECSATTTRFNIIKRRSNRVARISPNSNLMKTMSCKTEQKAGLVATSAKQRQEQPIPTTTRQGAIQKNMADYLSSSLESKSMPCSTLKQRKHRFSSASKRVRKKGSLHFIVNYIDA